jgi:2,3-bisphosphoglycerate-dependent phosphoglycerate mutase
MSAATSSSSRSSSTSLADTRLVLVRHGQANAFTEQFIAGHKSCSGLSDLGRRQVEALRDRLARTKELGDVDVLYASLMERAHETARIIAPALGDLAIKQDCGVCEIHPGDEVDGMRWEDFKTTFPEGVDVMDPFQKWSPGGESWAEFATRTGTRLTELGREHRGQTVVIACHGGVIESSFMTFGRLPMRHIWMQAENTSLTEWHLPADGDHWRLDRFNDAAHLLDL